MDFGYFKKNYKLVAIDLSKQTKLKNPEQINFIGKLLKNTVATMFFIIEKSEETSFKFSQNSVTITIHNHNSVIMETQKIVNLLNRSDNEISKFASKNGMLLTVNQKVIVHIMTQ